MRRLQHKLSLADQIQKEKKAKTQVIDQQQYNQKLNELLDKMDIQNNYANRIEKSNHNNILKIQTLESELKYLQQLKKMEDLNEGQLKEYNRQLMKNLQVTQTQLKKITVELYQNKGQIKMLKNQITRLQNQNQELLKDLLRGKRQKLQEFALYRQKIRQELLETHVAKFLAQNKWENTSLAKFCIQCQKGKDFKNFFDRLSQKLNSVQGILDRFSKREKHMISLSGDRSIIDSRSKVRIKQQQRKSMDNQWRRAIKSYNSQVTYNLGINQ